MSPVLYGGGNQPEWSRIVYVGVCGQFTVPVVANRHSGLISGLPRQIGSPMDLPGYNEKIVGAAGNSAHIGQSWSRGHLWRRDSVPTRSNTTTYFMRVSRG